MFSRFTGIFGWPGTALAKTGMAGAAATATSPFDRQSKHFCTGVPLPRSPALAEPDPDAPGQLDQPHLERSGTRNSRAPIHPQRQAPEWQGRTLALHIDYIGKRYRDAGRKYLTELHGGP